MRWLRGQQGRLCSKEGVVLLLAQRDERLPSCRPPPSCTPADQELLLNFFNSPAAARWRQPWHQLTALPDAYNYKARVCGGQGV